MLGCEELAGVAAASVTGTVYRNRYATEIATTNVYKYYNYVNYKIELNIQYIRK